MNKILKKNYKKIIVICLIMLLLSNKMYENFTTTQALDAVIATEKKVNDIFHQVDANWVKTNKNIYSAKEIKSNVAVKVGNITLAKSGNKLWAENAQIDNVKIMKKLCIGGTCLDENHLKLLTDGFYFKNLDGHHPNNYIHSYSDWKLAPAAARHKTKFKMYR
jgi:hypothetical protein